MNVNSRMAARIRQYESQQHSAGTPATTAELTTRTLATVWWTAAETIGASQTSTAERKPLTAGMPTTAETPTIVLASTGGQQQQRCYEQWMPTTHDFLQKICENLSELQKICKKKMQKLLIFSSIVFIQSDKYRTIGSPQLLV